MNWLLFSLNFDFSEIESFENNLLTIELWNRGMTWDKLLGVHCLKLDNYLPNTTVKNELILNLDSELCMIDGIIVGTQTPTGHAIYVEVHIEDVRIDESCDTQDKIELLNQLIEKGVKDLLYFNSNLLCLDKLIY